MPPTQVPKSERQLLKLTQYVGALCLGVMFGFIGSIESINPQIVFSLNWKVWVGLVFFGLFFWWLLGRIFASVEEDNNSKTSTRKPFFWMLFFCLTIAGLTLGGFIWTLTETNESRLRDVIIGNIIAFWVIGFCVLLVWNLFQFFEENSAEAEKRFNEEHNIPDGSDD